MLTLAKRLTNKLIKYLINWFVGQFQNQPDDTKI